MLLWVCAECLADFFATEAILQYQTHRLGVANNQADSTTSK